MLILSRKETEQIYLGEEIVLTIVRVSHDKVRIGIKAPPNVKVLRQELQEEGIEFTISDPQVTPKEKKRKSA